MSLYDILSQVAKIWGTLTTNEKDYYLLQQAGGLAPLSSEYAGTYLEPYILNYNSNVIAA